MEQAQGPGPEDWILLVSALGAMGSEEEGQGTGESWVPVGEQRRSVDGTWEGFLEELVPPYFPCSPQVNQFVLLFPREIQASYMFQQIIPQVSEVSAFF